MDLLIERNETELPIILEPMGLIEETKEENEEKIEESPELLIMLPLVGGC